MKLCSRGEQYRRCKGAELTNRELSEDEDEEETVKVKTIKTKGKKAAE